MEDGNEFVENSASGADAGGGDEANGARGMKKEITVAGRAEDQVHVEKGEEED